MLWSPLGLGCAGRACQHRGALQTSGAGLGRECLRSHPGGPLGAMPPSGARSSSLLSLPSRFYLFILFFPCGKRHNETCPLQVGL